MVYCLVSVRFEAIYNEIEINFVRKAYHMKGDNRLSHFIFFMNFL